MKNELTTRQQEVFDFIVAEIERMDRPPTVREISAHFGWSSSNAAAGFLKSLVRKGKIAIEPLAGRAITVLDRPKPGMPLLTMRDVSFGNASEIHARIIERINND